MKYTFLIAGICLCLIACKKDSDPSSSDKTQLLTSTDWKYDNGGIGDANGNILIDFSTLGAIPACSIDNTIRFNSNGSGTISENTNVCSGSTSPANFSWNFSADQTTMTVSGGAVAGISGNFKVKTLTASKLTLLKDTTAAGFGAVTAIFNLKH